MHNNIYIIYIYDILCTMALIAITDLKVGNIESRRRLTAIRMDGYVCICAVLCCAVCVCVCVCVYISGTRSVSPICSGCSNPPE